MTEGMEEKSTEDGVQEPDEGDLRVSDLERENVVAQLREHFSKGRLSSNELFDRIEACYDARTRNDLRQQVRDLVDEHSPDLAPEPPIGLPARPHMSWRDRRYLIAIVSPSIWCTVIWFLSGHHGSFWPEWVMLGSGIIATKHYVGRASFRNGRSRPDRQRSRDARRLDRYRTD